MHFKSKKNLIIHEYRIKIYRIYFILDEESKDSRIQKAKAKNSKYITQTLCVCVFGIIFHFVFVFVSIFSSFARTQFEKKEEKNDQTLSMGKNKSLKIYEIFFHSSFSANQKGDITLVLNQTKTKNRSTESGSNWNIVKH